MFDVDVVIDDLPRGCGHLVPGGYYLSSVGCDSKFGTLQNVTYPFGDGTDNVIYCKGVVPSRGMLLVNTAATFALQSVTQFDASSLSFRDGQRNLYESLCQRVLDIGLIDHVGTRHYTPVQFIAELYDRMPNRRIHPELARKLANLLPLPVVFTHSHIPVFRDERERDVALALYEEYAELNDVRLDTNWMLDDWGVFANNYDGRDHYMLPILALLDKVTRDWQQLAHSGYWRRVKKYFDSLTYAEQPFAISWFVQAIRIVNDGHELTQADVSAGIKSAEALKV